MLSKFKFVGLFLLPFVAQSALGTDTLFIGPSHLRVSEEGEFSRVENKPAPQPFDNLWAYRLYPEASQKKLTGRGVIVAIADSGISPHVEFNGKNIQAQDFTQSASAAAVKNHGMGVAGVIGARGVKFTGIAPNAQLFIYKIDDGSRLIGPQAATAAINTLLDYNEKHPDQKISVLNLSYGVHNGGNVPLTNAINRAHDSGVFIVCPSGNFGYPGVHYPANLSTTIAVGALAADGKSVYVNSTYGKEIDFIAPGEKVYTADNDGTYTLMSGTSVAAGFVSAAAALAVEGLKKKLGRYPTVDEIKQSLVAASVQLPGVPREKQGNGFIDVKKLEAQFN